MVMETKSRIMADLKEAMLQKRELERDTLRMVKADMVNREVEIGRDLSETEVITVLQRAVKTRADSAQQYDSGGRADAAAKEKAEIAVIQRYLPQGLSEEETRAAIEGVMSDLGFTTKADMGKLMGELKKRHGARLDGGMAARLAQSFLK